MAINENDLRSAGFTERDVADLHIRLSRSVETMDDLITAQARRFRVSLWLTVALIAWRTFRPLLAWKAHQLHKAVLIAICFIRRMRMPEDP